MSVESISRVLGHSKAEGTARLVLIVIANHDGDGGSWPSIATIARGARVGERSVQRAIKDLVELGEIVVHRNDGGTRKTRADRRPNRYEITIDPDADQANNGATPVTPRQTERGDTPVTPSHDHGVTPTAPRGDTAMSPEPSLTVQDPPSPGKPGAIGCVAHPAGRANCRACGTTPRQIEARARAEATERRRARNAELAAAERSKPRGRQPDAEAARIAARAALDAIRYDTQEATA